MEHCAAIDGRGGALKRLAVVLLAAAALLAAGLGLAPQAGWAEDEETVTAALTIVDTTDGTVVYNAAVEVEEGATVADLLAAAGFTEVDEESASTATSYYDSYSCPEFLGKGWDSETWCYWVAMYEGDSNNYADAYLTATVQDGGHYQYIYADYTTTTFEYDDEIADPLAAADDTDTDDDDTDAATTVTVAITVVDTTDGTVVYNAAVEVEEGATVADAFAAAGFTEAESEETSSSTSYYSSWDCPEFLGKGYDSSTGCYWVTMYEGSADNYASAYLSATVVDGGHYQYVYANYETTTFEYDDEDTVEAQLTIVDTTDSSVLYNGVVTVAEGATVADLLAAAGFTEVDSIEDTADGTSYYESWSCPEFLGKEYDSSTYAYWVAMYEGDGYNNYASAYLTATVQDGGHYQYIYGTSYTFEYDEDIADLNPGSIYDPLSGYTADDATDDTGTDDSSTDDTTGTDDAAVELDEEALATLLENLSARFSDGGSDEAISNSTVYAAIALNALGLGSQIDTDAILESLNSYEETYGNSIGAGTLAKYLMALTAGGYDCTELVAQMEALEDGTENIYSLVWILAVYDYGGYTVGEDAAWDLDALIDAIIASIGDEGLVGAYGYYDTQTTAQAILALLPYASESYSVAESIESMVNGLYPYQNADGGFGYASNSTDSNLDATANIVAALAATGYADMDDITTPAVAWLVAQADSTLDGYVESDLAYDEAMSSATVLMALAAYQIAPTSVYELQAVSTDAADAEAETTETEAEAETETEETETEEDSDETIVATGDGAAALTLTCGTLALAMLAAGTALRRRRAVEPATHRSSTRR